MTTRELAALIGKTTTVRVPGWHNLDFEVLVVDARLRYGNLDVLVHPVAGFGEQWICADRTALRFTEA